MINSHLFFSELKEEERIKVLKVFKEKKVQKNQILIREGEIGESAFLLAKGKVQVLKKSAYNECYVVSVIEAGGNEFFGEINLIDKGKRTSTIKTIEDSLILEVTKSNLKNFMDQNPEIGYKIMWYLAKSCAKHLRKADNDIITLYNALVEVVENE